MNRALRLCLVGLVLVNLGFVYITEAARLSWLLPLLGLTAASPWLVRLTASWAYRLLWNLAVLGAFALLVHHVTWAGAAFLLEDGLLLAALCQVHLVNNLSDAQKPDLIFFNSFLIAVVTSYLSLDLGYSLVFFAYAPLLVVAMQLLAVSRAGAGDAAPVWPVVRSGLLRGGGVVGVTLVVFLLFPRDFQRKGLLGETLGLAPPGSISEVAFSEGVDLRQRGPVEVSDRVVMTVKGEPRGPLDVPRYWRGATLDAFDGRQWRAARRVYEPDPWRRRGRRVWTRGTGAGALSLDVHLADPEAPRLFVPLHAQRVELDGPLLVHPLPDLNFRRVQMDRRPVGYRVQVTAAPPSPGGPPAPLRREIATHIALHPPLVPVEARVIARRLRAELPDDAPQHAVVERLRRHLAGSYRYLAPGTEGGAEDLGAFFAGRGGAHCEYFATALAVMLRAERIPCRVVTGYRSDEWDAERGILTVRARHAHAWVEVLDPEAGWLTVDPTPAVASGPGRGPRGLLGEVEAFFSGVWARITGFDADTRDDVLAWLAAAPGRMLEHPFATALCLGGLGLVLVGLRLRRRRRGAAAVRDYRATVRRLGLVLEPGETPRDLLARARRTAYPAPGLRRLEAATAAHELARYAL